MKLPKKKMHTKLILEQLLLDQITQLQDQDHSQLQYVILNRILHPSNLNPLQLLHVPELQVIILIRH